MPGFVRRLVGWHDLVFGAVERWLAGWLPALFARVAFAMVLAGYYWQSALARFVDGLAAPMRLTEAAYAEVLPMVAEAYAAAGEAMPPMPWAAVVVAVSLAQIVLPPLILVGFATRLAALAMALAVVMGTVADRLRAEAPPMPSPLGGLIDADPSGYLDQRLLWLVPLSALIIRGPGRVSVDRLLGPWLAAPAGPAAAHAGGHRPGGPGRGTDR